MTLLKRRSAIPLIAAAGVLVLAHAASGQRGSTPGAGAVATIETGSSPSLAALSRTPSSELREVVERFVNDRSAVARRYDAVYSPARRERMRALLESWRANLREVDFDSMGQEGRIDYVLLDHRLRYDLYWQEYQKARFSEMAALLPFAKTITELQDARRSLEPVDGKAAAGKLAELPRQVRQLENTLREGSPADRPGPVVGARAVEAVEDLRSTLGQWHRSYAGYDPLFTWWTADPFKKADEALRGYERFLRERIVGAKEGQPEPIVGDPIGVEGLKADLELEMIPYTPQELVTIAEREFAWCEAEMKKASRDMGFGDDWKAALEKVKTLHVEPGKQPELIRQLAQEAIEFVESRNLVTVPPLARETWRLEMMSPERQLVSPFFTGGEVISVAFPTESMAHEDKLMSMRGNNIHFSRATVQHELIPGHHLQQFMNTRYNPHRRTFGTPFWIEGWALYWEMLLWDLGFPKTPEDRIGMLFWRSHRAARIVFSLNVHLGRMTPQQAIDFLVDRVGHERANATAEVRRSFNGSYSPLYQAAYMLGGLQFRKLHQELVGGGKMSNREFHDRILAGGPMPVEMVRARLMGTPLRRDYAASWRFGDAP